MTDNRSAKSQQEEEERIELIRDMAFTDETEPDEKTLRKRERAKRRAEKEAKEAEKTPKQVFFEYVRIVISAVAVALFLLLVVFFNATVPSGSMNPTISQGDRLIGFRLAYVFSDPKRGDVAIFKCPEEGEDYDSYFVKRVIGLPGEVVSIQAGQVIITKENGETLYLNEDYLKEVPDINAFNGQSWVLGRDEYFMMGDNRNNSHDSRYFGAVTKKRIKAKVIWRYWKGFKSFKRPVYD